MFIIRMNHFGLRTITHAETLAAVLMLVFAWPSFESSFAFAQVTTTITPTSGVGDLGTAVTSDGRTIKITGGTRPDNGMNLFHSFAQFNVESGDTVKFLNTTPSLPTSNILSRVTSENPSNIFGTIDTMSYSGANFFLMNPAGIVFGPKASLQVGGSVAFTTADYLRLQGTNGLIEGIFHADPSATPQLSSTPIAAFGFLGSKSAAIIFHGNTLTVQPGKSISIVGGNEGFMGLTGTVPGGVTLTQADLQSPGGQTAIASVASEGEILAGTFDKAPNISDQSFGAFGKVQISQKSSIDTQGDSGGAVRIRGGRLVVNDSTIFTSTGDVLFDTTSIEITGADISTAATATGNGGHIILNASQDIDMSSVIVDSFSGNSSRHAGDITLYSDRGNLSLTNSFITSGTLGGSGNTGNIKIDVPRGDVQLFDSSGVFNTASKGTGTVENIQIKAHNLELFAVSKVGGDNRSTPIPERPQVTGNILIALDGHLSLAEGSFINTGTFGAANSADLIVIAPNILVTGKDNVGRPSQLFTGTLSSGDAGLLSLFTDNLRLENGGTLSSKTTIGVTKEIPSGSGGVISIQGLKNPGTSIVIAGTESSIVTSTNGTGPGGAIDLTANSLTIQNGGTILASTAGTDSRATGGSITIKATDQVILTNGASISANSTGPGNAGAISINAGQQLEVRDGSSITTQAAKASGGNIDIRAIDRIRFLNSTVSTSVLAEDGKGGNIFIDPNVVILEGSAVTAKAVGGAGGNITFVTPLFLADSVSLGLLSAKSESGLNGTVTIQSPTSNLSGTVGQLASKTSPPQILLQNRCVALAGGEQSTFILAGRDTLPSEPGGWLSSPVGIDHWTGEGTEDHASGLLVQRKPPSGSPVLAAFHDKSPTLSLRRLTPHGLLVRAFAAGTTGCPS